MRHASHPSRTCGLIRLTISRAAIALRCHQKARFGRVGRRRARGRLPRLCVHTPLRPRLHPTSLLPTPFLPTPLFPTSLRTSVASDACRNDAFLTACSLACPCATQKLTSLQKSAIAAAKAGDSAKAQAAVKDFIKVGGITVTDTIDGAIFNPKQRRNPGAPPTAEIEAQMGTQKFALYQPLKN
jgi:hypothetical protein